jgi:hypothetical protein
MSSSVAVCIIHGIGRQPADFAKGMMQALMERCQPLCGDGLVMETVHWAPVTQAAEDTLWQRLQQGGPLNYSTIRRFLIDFLADAAAYQIAPGDRQTYDAVHAVFASTLRRLAQRAGPTAPLIVIAHSLGSIIASNYLYDLQVAPARDLIAPSVREQMADTPLERGETLCSLFTLGSPIAFWSLRFSDFGMPISVPSPRLSQHYHFLPGEWVNIYDRDDVLAFPLRTLNSAYATAVSADCEIDSGGLLERWNPLSHLAYWRDDEVIERIAARLIATWRYLNPGAGGITSAV